MLPVADAILAWRHGGAGADAAAFSTVFFVLPLLLSSRAMWQAREHLPRAALVAHFAVAPVAPASGIVLAWLLADEHIARSSWQAMALGGGCVLASLFCVFWPWREWVATKVPFALAEQDPPDDLHVARGHTHQRRRMDVLLRMDNTLHAARTAWFVGLMLSGGAYIATPTIVG
ncbi:MAG: hypothetical protein AB7K09_01430 [Planctomycetota bacterium]